MDVRRAGRGEWGAAAGGLLLLLSLFLTWYERPGGGVRSGFEAFALTDVLLVGVGASALALLGLACLRGGSALPVAAASIAALSAIVGSALIAIRAAFPPDGAAARGVGLWLGLAAAAAVAAGALLSLHDADAASRRPTIDGS